MFESIVELGYGQVERKDEWGLIFSLSNEAKTVTSIGGSYRFFNFKRKEWKNNIVLVKKCFS